MKKNSLPLCVSKVLLVLLISHIYVLPVLAKEDDSVIQRSIDTSSIAFSILEELAQKILSFRISQTVNLTDIKSFPTNNSVLITWNADKITTGIIYYDTVSPLTISSSTSWVIASLHSNYAQSKGNIRRLDPDTIYFYKIVIKENAGREAVSEELSFTTDK